MENKPAISKQDIAKYVQDMAEIEAAEFTLRKAAEEMRNEVERTEKDNQVKIENYESKIKSDETRLYTLEKQLYELKDKLMCQDSPEEPPHLQEPEAPVKPVTPVGWKNSFLYDEKYHYLQEDRPIFSYNLSNWDLKSFIGFSLIIGLFAVSALTMLFTYSICILFGAEESAGIYVASVAISIVIYFVLCVWSGNRNYNKNKKKAYDKYTEIVNNYDKYSAYAKEISSYERRSAIYDAELAKAKSDYARKCAQYKKHLEIAESKQRQSKDSYEKLQKEINSVTKIISDNKKALLDTQRKQKADHTKHTFINAQIEILNKKIQEIHNKKQSLYQANIIPPDYRALDCVIMFHQIFRNDLADTMREAVKIYEERVFRQEVIRGIDKIYQMLGRLSASMSLIENRLVQIRDEVKLMGNDVYQISEKMSLVGNNQKEILERMDNYQSSTQKRLNAIAQTNAERQRVALNSMQKQQRLQEEQLAETRASRYATEALKDATDKLVYYENVKYWQSL